jgi:hypothetical protein
MSESEAHATVAWGVMAVGLVVAVALRFVNAPYGRHVRAGWGPEIRARAGWIVMESPSVLFFAWVYARGRHAGEAVPMALAALWLAHYVHRAFVYPLRFRSADRPMPASVAAMAIVFNLVNSWLNARWISELGSYDLGWLADPRFLAGAALFGGGLALNLHSDRVLIGLRAPGEQGYRVPHGGGFRLVSAPNYLGELIEWAGWALATWSLAGLSFAVFTAANLVPRAIANHRWYRATFADYPPERRAILPWLL